MKKLNFPLIALTAFYFGCASANHEQFNRDHNLNVREATALQRVMYDLEMKEKANKQNLSDIKKEMMDKGILKRFQYENLCRYRKGPLIPKKTWEYFWTKTNIIKGQRPRDEIILEHTKELLTFQRELYNISALKFVYPEACEILLLAISKDYLSDADFTKEQWKSAMEDSLYFLSQECKSPPDVVKKVELQLKNLLEEERKEKERREEIQRAKEKLDKQRKEQEIERQKERELASGREREEREAKLKAEREKVVISSAPVGKDLPKFAVWDLVPRNIPATHAQELTSILVSEISKLGKYEVYSQDNVRTLAGWTAERMQLGCTDTKCLTALGQMDIAKLISGSVGKIGNRYSVSLNLFDTQNAKAENAVSEFGRSEDELIELVQVALRKLLGVEVSPTRVEQRPSPSSGSEIGRDGRFIAYNNGTVLDTRTNLMWAAKDNGSDITWANAKSYCENYREGGYTDWRMPTQDELAGLYDSSKQRYYTVRLPELIQLSSCCPWALETRGSDAAYFSFTLGERSSYRQSSDYTLGRALPVRSGK